MYSICIIALHMRVCKMFMNPVQAVHFFPNGHISGLLYTTHFNPNFHSDRAQLGRWMFTYLIRLSEYFHLVACKCMQFSTPTHPNLKKEAYNVDAVDVSNLLLQRVFIHAAEPLHLHSFLCVLIFIQ